MNIFDYLEKHKVKISELSKACGIPYATLHNSLNNPNSIKAINLKKISDYLNIDMNQLFNMLNKAPESLLNILLDQKKSKLKGNLYHITQILFAYNTNRIEGSKLTEDETRYIFETNTLVLCQEKGQVKCVNSISDYIACFSSYSYGDFIPQ